MRWLKKHLWHVGMAACVSTLFLLSCLTLIPPSAASAHEEISGVATPTTVTVQVTPTVDTTVTSLSKEQLEQEVNQLKNQNFWSPWTNFATPFSVFAALVAASFGFWRWRVDRRDAQDKELKDRKDEREKRAEERFQSAVTGLGDDKEGARIGAAILLRTFLHPGYQEFYTQTFDLAVANLRLPRTSDPSVDPDVPLPLATLSQALITIFKEAFPLARDQEKRNRQFLDATDVQLDSAYLNDADLGQIWMPAASLRNARLIETNLVKANLNQASLRNAKLIEANLGGASLRQADLSNALLVGADLCGTDLVEANLGGSYLDNANMSRANLVGTDLCGASLSDANLSDARLFFTDLNNANLTRANFRRGRIIGANLCGANLSQADFSNALLVGIDLFNANLSEANLSEAKFSGSGVGLSADEFFDAYPRADNLSNTNLEDALSLKNTNLRGATGLTKEQLAVCRAKGAIIDEDPATSPSQSTTAPSSLPPSKDTQASSAPSAQEGTLLSDPNESNIAPS